MNRCYGTMQALVADFNSDGWPDLLLVNGSLDIGQLEPSIVLRNIEGREFREWLYLPGLDQPANFLGGVVAPVGSDGRRGVFLAANPALRNSQSAVSFYTTY